MNFAFVMNKAKVPRKNENFEKTHGPLCAAHGVIQSHSIYAMQDQGRAQSGPSLIMPQAFLRYARALIGT
jgi:hypothetical protein